MRGRRNNRTTQPQQVVDQNSFEALEEEEATESSRTEMENQSFERSGSNGDSNPGVVLVSNLLTNNNYLTWKHSMIKVLTIKKKLKFIESDEPSPKKGTYGYEIWKESDCLVIAWILNSIQKDFVESFIFTQSARSLRKEIEQRYVRIMHRCFLD